MNMGFFSALFGTSDTSELINAIESGAFLVDVRTSTEFLTGSIKGATNIPLDQIENQLSKFKNKKNIVVFCRSGNRSGQAKKILEQNGFKNIVNGGALSRITKIINE